MTTNAVNGIRIYLCISIYFLLVIWGYLVLLVASPCFASESSAVSDAPPRLRIVIHCSRNLLQVWLGAQLMKEYPIETGKGGTHKKRSGDHRTPIGEYEISWMASRHCPKGHTIIDGRS